MREQACETGGRVGFEVAAGFDSCELPEGTSHGWGSQWRNSWLLASLRWGCGRDVRELGRASLLGRAKISGWANWRGVDDNF